MNSMGELISRYELLKKIEESMINNPHTDKEIRANHNYEHRHFMKMVLDIPCIFDKEKVLKELKEELIFADVEKERCANENPLQFDEVKGYVRGIAFAIDVIEKGCIE